VAFVGASGCGKSTSVSLLERFYNAANGVLVCFVFIILYQGIDPSDHTSNSAIMEKKQ